MLNGELRNVSKSRGRGGVSEMSAGDKLSVRLVKGYDTVELGKAA